MIHLLSNAHDRLCCDPHRASVQLSVGLWQTKAEGMLGRSGDLSPAGDGDVTMVMADTQSAL